MSPPRRGATCSCPTACSSDKQIMRNLQQTMKGFRRSAFVLLLPAMLFLSACDRSTMEDDHDALTRAVIEIRATNEVIAEWTVQTGWNVDELRPIPANEPGGERMTVDGPRASLTVRLYDEVGNEFDIRTVSNVDGVRTCTEYSARYTISGGSSNVIAWPPLIEGGLVSMFVNRAGGERVAIFHCDHVYIYPEASGETRLQLQLWHLDHADAATDPLTLVVE